jgi:hypothetical protein
MLAAAVHGAPSFDEIVTRARDDEASPGRTSSAILLARTLVAADTGSGAGIFLAAEIVRDSLAAPRAARGLFVRIPTASPLAAKGWLAAARLAGDSAAEYVRIARGRWPDSPYLRALDGRATGDTLAIAADTLLRAAWDRAIVVYGDSLANRRAAPATSAASRRP